MVSGQIYIVGPCAAESREQVLETARQIIGVLRDRLRLTEDRPLTLTEQRPASPDRLIFRAGVWKPRTNPNTFQGIGNKALEWLAEVKQRYGLPIATEVATAEHVEAAMQAGIDYLWIGARTSANPIAVSAIAEKIADRLRLTEDRPLTLTEQRPASPDRTKTAKADITKTELPLKGILIKNPVNKDAALWLGNIERLEKTGVNVYAVHRGCGHEPCWSMAHQVRLARPDIPMLLDPSHMSGDAAQVPVLMEKIAELGLDGAMIEVHNHPAEALSDAKQQITPEELTAALTEDRPASPDRLELNWLRAEIDELDEHLWDTIAARMEVSQRIGAWKKAHGVAPLQPERYQMIVEKIKDRSADRTQTDFALRLYDLIHEESLRQQK